MGGQSDFNTLKVNIQRKKLRCNTDQIEIIYRENWSCETSVYNTVK